MSLEYSPSRGGKKRHASHASHAIGALGVEATAEYLGISRRLVYVLMDSGQLASFKIGNRRLIALSELERFLAGKIAEAG